MTGIRVHFAYHPIDQPWGGANNFTRALKETVSRTQGFAVAADMQGDYDVLFMTQLSRGQGHPRGNGAYRLRDIRAALAGGRRKLVIRAVNLHRNAHEGHWLRYALKYARQDRAIIAALNMADAVIFQSAFQQEFFTRAGYRGLRHRVIHNGAASLFLDVPGGPRPLTAHEPLRLISSAMAKRPTKRQDLIAALSRLDGVHVAHAGQWPAGLDAGAVEMLGVLTHDQLAARHAASHYMLHPALKDPCPNSLVEGLCAGLPVLFNPGAGSGGELAGPFGIALNEADLPGTVAQARARYAELAGALAARRHAYSIATAASAYMDVFRAQMTGTG